MNHEIAHPHPAISAQLAEVERRLAVVTAGKGTSLHRQLLSSRSKRLRPALLLLMSQFGSQSPRRNLLDAAVGVELLHEATLYHDDIVDDANLRRGETTTYREFGPAVAAFAGSELLYGTAEHFACLPPRLRRSVGRTVDALCRGQLREIEALGISTVGVRERLRIMRDKTARLFSLAAHLGATLGGSEDSVVRRLTRVGLQFGMCLQLVDDVRDLVATEEQLGRQPGSDLLDGVYTLPVVYGLSSAGSTSESLRDNLRRLLFSRNRAAVLDCVTLLHHTGGILRAIRTLQGWMDTLRGEVRTLRAVSETGGGMLSHLLDQLEAHAASRASSSEPPTSVPERSTACSLDV